MADILMDATRMGPPLASAYTTTFGTNSENPTKTDTTGRGLVVAFGSSPAAGDNLRGFTKAKPASSSYDIIARIGHTAPGFNFNIAALCVSDGTKYVTFGFATENLVSGGAGMKVGRWNTSTSYNTDRYAPGNPFPMSYDWLKWSIVSGDPSVFYVSENGVDWIEVFTESQTAFLTYTTIGLATQVTRNSGTLPVASTPQLYMNVLYYKDPDTDPGF